jgi:hypothetical protein
MKIKLIIYLTAIVTILFSCKSFAQPVNIVSIEVYYLPWNLKTREALNESDVRNFNDHKNYFVEFTSDSIISEFENALSLYEFQDTVRFYNFDVRMVIDFKLSNNQTYTISIGVPYTQGSKNRPIKTMNNFYRHAPQLLKVIDKYVPEKIALKDNEIKLEVEKGSLSEKEIEEYKSKGVKIIEK